MKFYTVSEYWISFLKNYDSKVPDNYNGSKTFTGIVLLINNKKYYAPLTSYKPKQDNLNDELITLYKLHERGNPENKLGMILLNNMIPVIDSELSIINFDLSTPKGKMLQKQYEFINLKKEEIIHRANLLHQKICNEKGNNKYRKLTINFKVLEDVYNNMNRFKKILNNPLQTACF